MQAISQRLRNITFFVLVSIFALVFTWFKPGWRFIRFSDSLLIVVPLTIIVLGLVVVVLTVRLKETRIKKVFFLLAGASAAAIPICALLHNVVYGLFILWFGEGFWERHGTDEPVFFILAVVFCPVLFLVGTVGAVVFLAKDFQKPSFQRK
jgi:hypothetical protein